MSKNGDEEEHDNFYHYQDQNYECENPKCNVRKLRNPDGTLKLPNPNIQNLPSDFLYHLGLGTQSHDLVKMFQDVKFVCMGGTGDRMEKMAKFIRKEIYQQSPEETTLENITEKALRFSMYKVGRVLCVSHGMGVPSIGILLHEIIKLMYHAKVKDPIFFRLGTSGGIGIEGGHVVISNKAIDEHLNCHHEQRVCGKLVRRPAILDQKLVEELVSLAKPDDLFKVVTGTTLCSNDFYEGQGRTDGAFCDHSEEDKMKFLKELHSKGVRNIEMEASIFAAMTNHVGIKSAVVNVTLLNRLNGDQVTTPKEVMDVWQNYPQKIVARYIKKVLTEC